MSEPITGVVSMSSLCDWVWDEIYVDGINLSIEEYQQQWKVDRRAELENGDEGEFSEEDWSELEDAEDNDVYPQSMYDGYESYEEEFLWGDWGFNKSTQKYFDFDGPEGFSAIVGWLGGAPILHVIRSKTIKRYSSMCSPCCPGQADIDSGEAEVGIPTFTLPDEFFWQKEEA